MVNKKNHSIGNSYYYYSRFKHLTSVNAIHPESQENVNLARSHLQINLDEPSNDGVENEASTSAVSVIVFGFL